MYISANVAERIKALAKGKNIPVKQLLEAVGLGFNTMANMKTSMPKADNLAKIADYLDCSVDYLLGRTEDPSPASKDHSDECQEHSSENMLNSVKHKKTAPTQPEGAAESLLIDLYRELNAEGQERLIDTADDLVKSGKYIKTHPHHLAAKEVS